MTASCAALMRSFCRRLIYKLIKRNPPTVCVAYMQMIDDKHAFVAALHCNQIIKLLFPGRRHGAIHPVPVPVPVPHSSLNAERNETQAVCGPNAVCCKQCKEPVEFELYVVCTHGGGCSCMEHYAIS